MIDQVYFLDLNATVFFSTSVTTVTGTSPLPLIIIASVSSTAAVITALFVFVIVAVAIIYKHHHCHHNQELQDTQSSAVFTGDNTLEEANDEGSYYSYIEVERGETMRLKRNEAYGTTFSMKLMTL